MAGLTTLGGIGAALQNLTLGNVATTIAKSATGSILGSVAKAASVDRITQRKSQNLRIRQLQERQRLEQDRLAKKTTLDKQKIQIKSAEDERKRRRALKRAVARSQVSFAGRGLANGGGSSDAILLGLFNETDQDRADRKALDRIRTTALDQNLDNRTSRNLLETNQLRAEQRLKNQIF